MISVQIKSQCWTRQGSLSCSPWNSVCNNWTATVPHTQLYARLWRYLSSYSKLVDLCVWILFKWYQKLKVSCMVVF